MGSVCSCFLLEDMEEHPHSNALAFRNCICLRYLGQQFINVYIALFQRGVHAATSSVQERITFVSQAATVDDSIPDTYQSPPRPIPYDDPRFSRPHHGVMSNNKFLSHYHEESESCRSSNVCETESSRMESKSKSDFDSRSKSESSLKNTAEARKEITHLFPSSEEEDVCPTCLEEYTSEDPKIIMQCSHHFHLGCIYEWMERSEACPVCGKMMVFKEAT